MQAVEATRGQALGLRRRYSLDTAHERGYARILSTRRFGVIPEKGDFLAKNELAMKMGLRNTKMSFSYQRTLFDMDDARVPITNASLNGRSGAFVDNMALPIHRWYRYSAGFSADWVHA